MLGDNCYGAAGGMVEVIVIVVVEFVTKESIPYSGTGWKNRTVSLTDVQDGRNKKETQFCSMGRGGRGGRGPEFNKGGNMSVEIGGVVPVSVLLADRK